MVLSANTSAISDAAGDAGRSSGLGDKLPEAPGRRAEPPERVRVVRSVPSRDAVIWRNPPLRALDDAVGNRRACRRARRGAVLCRSLGAPATNATQEYMDQNTQLFVATGADSALKTHGVIRL